VSKRVGVRREWRKLFNEVLNDLHFSRNIFCVMGCARSAYGERVGVYRVLVGYLREKTTWKTQT
jgi:hypothetical protein